MRTRTIRLAMGSLILSSAAILAGCPERQTVRTTEAPAPTASHESSRPAETSPAQPTATGAPSQPATGEMLAATHPEQYTVQTGDTLWDIAGRFLEKPWYWPEIWYNNPEIANPHLIYPGDVVELIYVDGKPRLQVARGRPTVKLSPHIRERALPKAINAIPLDAIRPFLVTPQILETGEFDGLPHLVGSRDNHLAMGAGHKVYARPLDDDPAEDFHLLRRGERFVDPQTGELLGIEAINVGQATLLEEGDPASLRVTQSEREVLLGDRLKPRDEQPFERRFIPRAPEQPVDGQVIHLVDAISQIGQYQVAVINRGAREGLEPGHVLGIDRRGSVVVDEHAPGRPEVKLPDERSGVMIVFRVFDKLSYGLVMGATRPIHRLDRVTNP